MAERFDLAVVGAGPAGIAAATAAAGNGRSVVVLDESPRPGGQIWRHRAGHAPAEASGWLQRLEASGATVRNGVCVVDVERTDGTFELLTESGSIRAGGIVLATGARERFLPFPGWTLPNVTGVGGAQALLKSGASFDGKRVVIAGSGPLLLPVSAALAEAGARVLLVAEQATGSAVAVFAAALWRSPGKLVDAARYRMASRAAPYRTSSWVTRARGSGALEAVDVSIGGRMRSLRCDVLCTGFGLVPALELPRLLGCELARGSVRVDGMQRTSVENIWCAGEGTGIKGMDAALVEGTIAGLSAAGKPGAAAHLIRERDRGRAFAARLARTFAPRPELRALADAQTLVCRCEDVARCALRPEWAGRQAKLYTRLGMGPCQARVCGPAVDFLFGWEMEGGRGATAVARAKTLAGEKL